MLPQLHSPHLLAVLPPVQPAEPPSSSREGLPAKQAGWLVHVCSPGPLPSQGHPAPLGRGPGPALRATALAHLPIAPQPLLSRLSPFGSPGPSSSRLTPPPQTDTQRQLWVLSEARVSRSGNQSPPGIPALFPFSPSLPRGGYVGSSWGVWRDRGGLRAQHPCHLPGHRPRAPEPLRDLLGLFLAHGLCPRSRPRLQCA